MSALKLLADFGKDFIEAGLFDFLNLLTFKSAFTVLPYFDSDGFFGIEVTGDEAGFDFFGELRVDSEDNGEVVRDIVGAGRDNTDILEITFFINGN